MAKKKTDAGLPYLKFSPAKWITGDISECSLAAQGLFVNLCCLYWMKQGRLSFDAMKRKFPRKSKVFGELLDRGILKSNADDLTISFLDEQLTERGLVSEQNRKAAELRWNQDKSDAGAMQTQSERTANAMPIEENRIEKNREEEKREEDVACVEPEIFSTNVPHEAIDLTDALCEYFSVAAIVTSKIYNSVCDYVATITHRNELQIATTALQKYMAYKARSQEVRHNITSWIGTKSEHYQDGQWIMTDWEAKNKNYQTPNERITRKVGTTSSQVAGTEYKAGGGL